MSAIVYTASNRRGIGRVIPDLVRARGLLWDLISKDLRARYRNALMGFFWAVLQPILMMLILTFVFGVVFPGRVGGAALDVPYSLFLLCGLIFWLHFSASLSRATSSLLENHDLIKKVYFPREVIPLASMGKCTVDLAIGFTVLIVYQIAKGYPPGAVALALPAVFAVQLALTLGLSLLTSSLNVLYRDVGYATEVALTLGFYATPVFYSLEQVRAAAASEHAGLFSLYMLNPLVGLLSAYRDVLLYGQLPGAGTLLWPAVCALVALATGAYVFRRLSPTIADYL